MTNISNNYDRAKGAPWFEEGTRQDLTIVGAGGIGSWLALYLSRTNPASLTIYDPDVIERVNMTGQFYTINDISKYKVDAVYNNLYDFGYSNRVATINERYSTHVRNNIVFGALDNMKSRKEVFDTWKKTYEERISYTNFDHIEEAKNEFLFMDGRLTAEQIQIFCFTANDDDLIRKYEEEHLFDDSEAAAENCTFKQTSHMAAIIGGMMTTLYTNYLGNRVLGANAYYLPFYTQFFGPTLNFETEIC